MARLLTSRVQDSILSLYIYFFHAILAHILHLVKQIEDSSITNRNGSAAPPRTPPQTPPQIPIWNKYSYS